MPLATYTATDDYSGQLIALASIFGAVVNRIGDSESPKDALRFSSWIWFPNIDIPAGATIARARMRIKPAATKSLGPGSTLTVDIVEDITTRQAASAIISGRGPELAPPPFTLFHTLGTLATEAAAVAPTHPLDLDEDNSDEWFVIQATATGILDRLEMRLYREDVTIVTGDLAVELWSLEGEALAADDVNAFLCTSDDIAVTALPLGAPALVTFSFTGGNQINIASGRPLAVRVRLKNATLAAGENIILDPGRARTMTVVATATGTAGVEAAHFLDPETTPFVERFYHIESLFPGVNNGENDTRVTDHIVVNGALANLTLAAPSFTADVVETWGDSGFATATTRSFVGSFAAAIQDFIDRPGYAPGFPLTLCLSTTAATFFCDFYSIDAGVAQGTPLLEVEYDTEVLDIVTVWTDEDGDTDPSVWNDPTTNEADPVLACDIDPVTYCIPTGEICEQEWTDEDGDPSTTWTDEDGDPAGGAWTDEDGDPSTAWTDTESS